METSSSNQLSIKLGETVSKKLQTVSEIKHAMTVAMMLHLENDLADRNNPAIRIFSSLYHEANYIEHELKKL